MIILLIALLYIGIMIYLANIEQVRGETHPLLMIMQYGLVLLIGVWVFNALTFLVISPEQVADPDFAIQLESISKRAALGFVIIGVAGMIMLVALIRSPLPHRWIEGYIYRNADEDHAYDSTLSVHKLAMMLVVVQILTVAWTFVVSGGLAGLDFAYESSLQALLDLAVSALLYVTFALLGVGWITRRTIGDILERLSLRFPTMQDVIQGMSVAMALFLASRVLLILWSTVVSPEVLEQQTAASQQLFEAFNSSLVLGFILALLTGVSEEILFRGALQPVFGLVPTALFFTVIHIQYTLTPATLILFVVSLGFGWLRLRVSTTAAIIAHMTYNFIPFLLFALFSNSGAV